MINCTKKFYILYLITILKKYLNKIIIFNNDITLVLNSENNLLIVSKILKNHSYFNYQLIQDITVIDYPNKVDRFQLIYNYLSIKRNFRLIVKFNLNEFKSINSLTYFYKSSN
jgi:NADH dehydrogenase (ubiquinone) Fe-S protein 3